MGPIPGPDPHRPQGQNGHPPMITLALTTEEAEALHEALGLAHMERINQMVPASDPRLSVLARVIELIEAETVQGMIDRGELKPGQFQAQHPAPLCGPCPHEAAPTTTSAADECPTCGESDGAHIEKSVYTGEANYRCESCCTEWATLIIETLTEITRGPEAHPCERCRAPVPTHEHVGHTLPNGRDQYLCTDCFTLIAADYCDGTPTT